MSESKASNESREICGLCNKNGSKYCCPRCGVFYCSLNCYKSEKHVQCSESFYRDCVNQELASHEVDDDSKRKMIDILKNIQNNNEDSGDNVEDFSEDADDSDDDLETDLHSRIQNLNLNDPDAIWNVLTNDERNEFEALINGDNVASILPLWEPWWLYYEDKQLIEEIKDKDKTTVYNKCPPLKNVPQFETLTTVKPSPTISFNISNILASYAFVMRYFNGEVDPMEGAVYMLEICSNLKSSVNFDNMEVATETVAQSCLQSQLIDTDKDSLDVMKDDTLKLLRGPSDGDKLHYTRAALSHLVQMFADCKSKLKTQKQIVNGNSKRGEFSKKYPDQTHYASSTLDKSQVNKVMKKLEYYLSFLNSCDRIK